MTNKDKILFFLKNDKRCLCDDCLSKLCDISPRQTVRRVLKHTLMALRQLSWLLLYC